MEQSFLAPTFWIIMYFESFKEEPPNFDEVDIFMQTFRFYLT